MEKDKTRETYQIDDIQVSQVCESAPCEYGRQQGNYTLEDYYALPEDQRVELIDGNFFVMEAPTILHQMLGGEIYHVLHDYIKRKKGLCVAAYSPLDVQLDCDNRTMVQPDVLVVCDRKKIVRRGVIFGAPDLTVEILSPSTRWKDMYLKLKKYDEAGVREYWLVDPDRKRVVVYDLENGECPAVYSFEDTVPVGIFGGECAVNFSEIYKYLKFLYQNGENDEDAVNKEAAQL